MRGQLSPPGIIRRYRKRPCDNMTLQMNEIAQLVEQMISAGVIKGYAVFGAVAQMRYTEPVPTLDVDILVEVSAPDRLDVLSDIYAFCRSLQYESVGESVQVGNWPVQFIPVFSELSRDALATAQSAAIDGEPFRVVRADYLALLALSVGRNKDHLRVLALLDSSSVTANQLAKLADRYGLVERWHSFESKYVRD